MLAENPKEITCAGLRALGEESRGHIRQIILHWTAGHYGQAYDDYHLNIDKDGQVYQTCTRLSEKKEHTFQHNVKTVGIALCCGADAVCKNYSSVNFGSEPPTPLQIERMAGVVAILAEALGIYITHVTVVTHAEVANAEGYGVGSGDPDMRWDLLQLPDLPLTRELKCGGDVLRGKALWYQTYYAKRRAGLL